MRQTPTLEIVKVFMQQLMMLADGKIGGHLEGRTTVRRLSYQSPSRRAGRPYYPEALTIVSINVL